MTILFASTIFLAAFLLFQIQPLIGKFILPWFGGGAEVWTICLLFFQLMLPLGYAWSHYLSYSSPRRQSITHALLLIAAILALPILPAPDLKPTLLDHPIQQILTILFRCVALPYIVLAAASPLLQRWYHHLQPDKSPWPLYALSNAASLLALLTFPFLFEPFFARTQIAKIWTIGLIAFVALCLACAAAIFCANRKSNSRTTPSAPEPLPQNTTTDFAPPAPPSHRIYWLALPALACSQLLAVTNKICIDIAPIPFLWILPLSIYLITFILCFQRQSFYNRLIWRILFMVSLFAVILVATHFTETPLTLQIAAYLASLVTCCMICHGELFRLRPHPDKLTSYYLNIAVGGALGGFFVAVIAPLCFKTYLEFSLGLIACCLVIFLREAAQNPNISKIRYRLWIAAIAFAAGGAVAFEGNYNSNAGGAILKSRNFFGTLTLWRRISDNPYRESLILQHGNTYHGIQFQTPEWRDIPVSYFSTNSGVGRTFQFFPKSKNRNIGVVGLGAGTLAAYAKPGDSITFFEINPAVVDLAKNQFTYLADSRADLDIVLGDARISLENRPHQNFDILVLDAFTSDAIPSHLLTQQAFEIYLRHLAPDGAIAFHVTNNHLDIRSIVCKLAIDAKIPIQYIKSPANNDIGAFDTDWVIISNNSDLLDKIAPFAAPLDFDPDKIDLWTDDHINLFQIFKF